MMKIKKNKPRKKAGIIFFVTALVPLLLVILLNVFVESDRDTGMILHGVLTLLLLLASIVLVLLGTTFYSGINLFVYVVGAIICWGLFTAAWKIGCEVFDIIKEVRLFH